MDFKIIAVDFDGTLCENKWPEIGEPNKEVIDYLKKQKDAGARIILWTCRTKDKLTNAITWCSGQGLEFDAVNQNIQEAIEKFGEDTRKVFANEYIDDRMCEKFELPYVTEEKADSQSWAEREIEIACKQERAGNETPNGEFDYGCACYESALKAYQSLCEDGHSGFSIGLTKRILNRLIEHKPLTPIEDTDDVWSDISDISGLHGEEANYQCNRMSSLFKYVYADASVKYRDVDRSYGVTAINNSDVSYYSGLVDRIIDEMFPITMPYSPEGAIKVVCEEFLTDEENGDFDTVGVLYCIKPNGEKVLIDQFFKESDNGWDKICFFEYCDRKKAQIVKEKTYDTN